ncbi:MAG: ketoacyl-ACP synthase III [Candidatus Sumerlaeia bacterium]|nr:ketoacyl-ACP synthase III [Candidatus Sumerlaeia bacterium]
MTTLNFTQSKPVGILGLGTAVPDKILTNQDLEEMVDTNDEWIVTRTGIRERRVLSPGEKPIDIVIPAARKAIEESGLKPSEINGLIFCTYTPDYIMPASACLLQGELGLGRDGLCYDLNAACTGFVYGMQVGWATIRSGLARNILLVGADFNSMVTDYTDRSTCILFGDGAGAVVLGEVDEGSGILGNSAGVDGQSWKHLMLSAGGCAAPITAENLESRDRYIQMNGREVFKFAVRAFNEAFEKAAADAGIEPSEVDLLIPHQANIRIIQSAMDRYGFNADRVVINIEKYGNTSAGSIPLALETARQEGKLRKGMTCALVAFGGGLTHGATILRW